MSIVTWHSPSYGDPDAPDGRDRVASALVHLSPSCLFCGETMRTGERAWVWHAVNDHHIVAHTSCLARHASGILGDIATAVRR